MKDIGYYLFETPLGPCGIAWAEAGEGGAARPVTYFQFPEATPARTEASIARNSSGHRSDAPPPQIGEILERVRRHLQGEAQDFRDVILDLSGAAPFEQQVYAAAREIRAGQTKTYGELAKALRPPGDARDVGQALGRNPIALIIPCHRVLAAGGKPGGFSAHGGRATKAKLLALEGVTLGPGWARQASLSF